MRINTLDKIPLCLCSCWIYSDAVNLPTAFSFTNMFFIFHVLPLFRTLSVPCLMREASAFSPQMYPLSTVELKHLAIIFGLFPCKLNTFLPCPPPPLFSYTVGSVEEGIYRAHLFLSNCN